jgi:hypothetical protein
MSLSDRPYLIFALTFAALWLSSLAGAHIRKKRAGQVEIEREDLGVILNATLTLLALVIGFSFAMATGRYDQRKNYEEAEANAIGTEYVRVAMLPPADATRARNVLRSYLDQRILFYTTRDSARLDGVNATTSQLQNDLWSTVQAPCAAQPTAVSALILSGMNDVLNSQGYTQAAWWNRIPTGAWILMVAVGIFCNVLFGYVAHVQSKKLLFFGLPLLVSVAFFLLADMDSPRGGVIRVQAQNLVSLSATLGRP